MTGVERILAVKNHRKQLRSEDMTNIESLRPTCFEETPQDVCAVVAVGCRGVVKPLKVMRLCERLRSFTHHFALHEQFDGRSPMPRP